MKIVTKIALLALATMGSLPMMGQDLLARQAPIDKKMKAVDSVALQRIIYTENYDSPAEDLYEDWSNKYAHHETALPDSFRISLKDFCMPTDSRLITSNFGARWGRQHKGLDIKVYIGDTIRAAFSGKVRVVRYEGRTTTAWRPFTATCRSNSSPKTRKFVPVIPSDWVVIRVVAQVPTCTSRHASAV